MKPTFLLAVFVIFGTDVAAGQGQPIALARQYADALHGFSLQPPAGAQRTVESGSARLVSWVLRDEQTGTVVWTLTVGQVIEAGEKLDLEPYSKALAEKLAKDNMLSVQSIRLTTVAGKSAIELVGTTGTHVKLHHKQVWVLAEEGRFLVFSIATPQENCESAGDVLKAVLATVKFIDPEQAKKAMKENLDRALDLLAQFDGKMLAGLIEKESQWYLFRLKGQEVGFFCQSESAGIKNGLEGYILTVWAFLELPDVKPRMLKRAFFATADGSAERWQEQMQEGEGGQGAESLAEDGFVQGKALVCMIDRGKKVDVQKQRMPAGIPYLTRAAGLLLPRLVDLSAPASYSFATYTTATNKFDMRTFTVVGPEKITVDGRTVEAIKATDKPAIDAEETTVWLGPKGKLLRLELADGLTMELADRQQVLARFPTAERLIQATAQWANQP